MSQDNPYQPPKAEVADIQSGDDSELATRASRFGAAVLDTVFMMVAIVPMMFVMGVWDEMRAGRQMTMGMQLQMVAVGLVTYVLFNGYLLNKSGQTLGKRIVGLRIVSFDDNRLVPLSKILMLRYAPFAVAGLIPFVGQLASLVDALFIFRNDRRCLHDLICATKVVNAAVPYKTAADE